MGETLVIKGAKNGLRGSEDKYNVDSEHWSRLDNVYITPTGGIKKRDGFVDTMEVLAPTNDSVGMVYIDGTLYCLTTERISSTVFIPIHIQHPFSPNAKIKKVLGKSVVKGKLFSIVQFDDDDVFVYYGNDLVRDWLRGRHTATTSDTQAQIKEKIATAMAQDISANEGVRAEVVQPDADKINIYTTPIPGIAYDPLKNGVALVTSISKDKLEVKPDLIGHNAVNVDTSAQWIFSVEEFATGSAIISYLSLAGIDLIGSPIDLTSQTTKEDVAQQILVAINKKSNSLQAVATIQNGTEIVLTINKSFGDLYNGAPLRIRSHGISFFKGGELDLSGAVVGTLISNITIDAQDVLVNQVEFDGVKIKTKAEFITAVTNELNRSTLLYRFFVKGDSIFVARDEITSGEAGFSMSVASSVLSLHLLTSLKAKVDDIKAKVDPLILSSGIANLNLAEVYGDGYLSAYVKGMVSTMPVAPATPIGSGARTFRSTPIVWTTYGYIPGVITHHEPRQVIGHPYWSQEPNSPGWVHVTRADGVLLSYRSWDQAVAAGYQPPAGSGTPVDAKPPSSPAIGDAVGYKHWVPTNGKVYLTYPDGRVVEFRSWSEAAAAGNAPAASLDAKPPDTGGGLWSRYWFKAPDGKVYLTYPSGIAEEFLSWSDAKSYGKAPPPSPTIGDALGHKHVYEAPDGKVYVTYPGGQIVEYLSRSKAVAAGDMSLSLATLKDQVKPLITGLPDLDKKIKALEDNKHTSYSIYAPNTLVNSKLGQSGLPAEYKYTQVTLKGDWLPTDLYSGTIILESPVRRYPIGETGMPDSLKKPQCCFAYNDRMIIGGEGFFAISDIPIEGQRLSNFMRWRSFVGGDATFLEISTKDGGSATAYAINSFNESVLIFCPNEIQMYRIGAGHLDLIKKQSIEMFGTSYPFATLDFHAKDCYFANDFYIRSIRSAKLGDSTLEADTYAANIDTFYEAEKGEPIMAYYSKIGAFMTFRGRSAYLFNHYQHNQVNGFSRWTFKHPVIDVAFNGLSLAIMYQLPDGSKQIAFYDENADLEPELTAKAELGYIYSHVLDKFKAWGYLLPQGVGDVKVYASANDGNNLFEEMSYQGNIQDFYNHEERIHVEEVGTYLKLGFELVSKGALLSSILLKYQ